MAKQKKSINKDELIAAAIDRLDLASYCFKMGYIDEECYSSIIQKELHYLGLPLKGVCLDEKKIKKIR